MSYKVVKYGKKAERRNFSRMPYEFELPNLIENQKDSFNWFIKEGVREVLEDVSPIEGDGHDCALRLYLSDHFFEESDVNTIKEAKEKGVNYSNKLMVLARLENVTKSGEIKEEKVKLCDLPIMTPSGTFVIMGNERVVVSQIVRSSGAYFVAPPKDSDEGITAQIIPTHGAWIEIEPGAQSLYIKLDRTKKIPFITFLKGLGFDNDTIKETFKVYLKIIEGKAKKGKKIIVGETLEEIEDNGYKLSNRDAVLELYRAQKEGESTTYQEAKEFVRSRLFEKIRYDLNAVGRYKINKKLNVLASALGYKLAEDLFNAKTGELILPAGTLISKEHGDSELSTYEILGNNRDSFRVSIIGKEKSLQNELLEDIFTAREDGLEVEPLAITLGKDIYVKTNEGTKAILLSKGVYLGPKQYNMLRKNFYHLDDESKEYVSSENLDIVNLVTTEEIVSLKDGSVIVPKGEVITDTVIARLRQNKTSIDDKFRNHFLIHDCYESYYARKSVVVEQLKVLVPDTENEQLEKELLLIGNDQRELREHITISDIVAFLMYYLNLSNYKVGEIDDIDKLGNRRIKLVGELLKNSFRVSFAKIQKTIRESMSTKSWEDIKLSSLVNVGPLNTEVKKFFGSSQLSQFMDQINLLAELTQKRRITAQGTGGIQKERAGVEVRDVHPSHFGRLCPIETPEGASIGLIFSLASYAKIDMYGFIETPYFKVEKNKSGVPIITSKVKYLNADDEYGEIIASAASPRKILSDGTYTFDKERIVARKHGETSLFNSHEVSYIDVSPKQIVSVCTAAIPFLEHDDGTRALMGSNMQRQAVPLVRPESPIVGTGIEYRVAKDSGTLVVSDVDGVVTYVDSSRVVITLKEEAEVVFGGKVLYDGKEDFNLEVANRLISKGVAKNKTFDILYFVRSNQDNSINQHPIVKVGEKIEKGDIIADGPTSQNGELALGRNVVVAFMTFDGYNFEDAVIMSEELVKNDVYSSIHIDVHDIATKVLKGNGGRDKEEFTNELPNVSRSAVANLDDDGIVIVGSEVKEDDILVGKITPKGDNQSSQITDLLHQIIGEKSKDYKDSSLRVPHGSSGIVQDVRILDKAKGDKLQDGINKQVRVFIAQKRKIMEGDKMAGRHGNKGVISKILPREDMPYMADGTPIDIILNPQGVPSRMNFGQVLELPLGLAGKKLGVKFATPVFDPASDEDIKDMMKEANVEADGKTVLYDGRTGLPYENRIGVGIMYMIKLSHMVDDKLHARNTGPYAIVSQQPLGGKAQNGGQRFGEMEVWALYAYGAAHTLQEILTYKSDDIVGRNKVNLALSRGDRLPVPSIPESFRVLTRQLKGLGLYSELEDSTTGLNEVTKSIVDNKKGGYRR
ncbi:MAG: DNA-directed RNA polymerase subunit beta [Acholeplasmatales bacterium]|jgi:DNA-directed RNA polymerase subunit beta|nr:DNA-directed RNA polymerase subunit beta [Acholeplasmatales bacterium]